MSLREVISQVVPVKSVLLMPWLLAMLSAAPISAQKVTGSWSGTPDLGGIDFPLEIMIEEAGYDYTAKLRSPLQSDEWIISDTIIVTGDTLHIEIKQFSFDYDGVIHGDSIVGIVTQRGTPVAANLSRGAYPTKEELRPQTPQPPYPYEVIELVIPHSQDSSILLAGTLTKPRADGPPRATVILISGSGPQDRNEQLLGHQPFKVIADHLTRAGIAVLRYDDRGVGGSTGQHVGATSADFMTDAASWLDYLIKRVDIEASRIGVLGHSEGGLIGAMLAAKRAAEVAFLIKLAGPGVDGVTVLSSQLHRKAELDGVDSVRIAFDDFLYPQLLSAAATASDPVALRSSLQQILITSVAEAPAEVKSSFGFQQGAGLVAMLSDPWMMYFLQSDVADYLEQVNCPVLAINGDKDYQVIADINLPGVELALDRAGNRDVTTVVMANHNHLFQECSTGSFREYSRIRQTISGHALEVLTDWLLERF